MRLLVPMFAIVVAAACGGSTPEPASPEPTPTEAPEPAAPAEPAPQAVPEGFPEVAGEAIEALSAGGRLARCKAPDEVAAGAYRTDGGAFVAVHDGWIVMTANAPEGTATMWSGSEPAFTVRWSGAEGKRWGTCRPARFHTFEITGKVLDDGGQPVAGATVGACLRGKTAVSDERGVFTLMGLPDQRCLVYAAREEDGDLLRVGGPVPVMSQGEDVLTEIVADSVVGAEERKAWFARLPRGSELRARAMQNGFDLRRRHLEGKEGEAATLANRWLDEVIASWTQQTQSADKQDQDALATSLGAIGG